MANRVLLVEDEAHIVEAIRFLLEREGWTVDTHGDGASALEKVDQTAPDLLVLDYMLPGRSGLDIIKDLRQRPHLANLPILMLTAKGQAKDREQAERAGVTRFMTKPFSNREILTAVRDMMYLALREREDASQQ